MSGAGTGGNDDAAAAVVAGAAAGEGAQGAPEGAPDLQAFIGGKFDEHGSRFDALAERLERLEQPPEEPGEPGPAAADAGLQPQYTDDDFDQNGGLSLEALAREQQRLARAEGERVLNAVQAERQQERWDAELDALEEKYPDLQDPEKQEKYINLAVERARELGDPNLAKNPKLLQSVYLESRAEEAASRETPAGDQREVSLERGGGAGPAAAASGDERGDKIVAAGKGQQFRLGG